MRTIVSPHCFICIALVFALSSVWGGTHQCNGREQHMNWAESLSKGAPFEGNQRRCVLCTSFDCTYCQSTRTCKLVDDSCPVDERSTPGDQFSQCKSYTEKLTRYENAQNNMNTIAHIVIMQRLCLHSQMKR